MSVVRSMILGAVLVVLGAALLEVPLGLRDTAIGGGVAIIGALLLVELVRHGED